MKMQTLSKISILTIISLLFAAPTMAAEQPLGKKYVSIECPKGDITLELSDDKRFKLSINYWAKDSDKLLGSDSITGTWEFAYDELVLNSKQAKIKYEREPISLTLIDQTAEIDALSWESSSAETFASGFDLLEQESLDELLKSANVE